MVEGPATGMGMVMIRMDLKFGVWVKAAAGWYVGVGAVVVLVLRLCVTKLRGNMPWPASSSEICSHYPHLNPALMGKLLRHPGPASQAKPHPSLRPNLHSVHTPTPAANASASSTGANIPLGADESLVMLRIVRVVRVAVSGW